jgi:hypothetical protein
VAGPPVVAVHSKAFQATPGLLLPQVSKSTLYIPRVHYIFYIEYMVYPFRCCAQSNPPEHGRTLQAAKQPPHFALSLHCGQGGVHDAQDGGATGCARLPLTLASPSIAQCTNSEAPAMPSTTPAARTSQAYNGAGCGTYWRCLLWLWLRTPHPRTFHPQPPHVSSDSAAVARWCALPCSPGREAGGAEMGALLAADVQP